MKLQKIQGKSVVTIQNIQGKNVLAIQKNTTKVKKIQ